MLDTVLNFLVKNIMSQPAIFMGILVFVGCRIRKLPSKDTLISTVKAVVGMLVLDIGSRAIVASSRPILDIFVEKMGVVGVVTDIWAATYVASDLLEAPGIANFGLVMLGGFALNLILARTTKWKTIHLTLQGQYTDAAGAVFIIFALTGLTGVPLCLAAIVLCGASWWISSYLIKDCVQPIVNDMGRTISVGHASCFSSFLICKLAKRVGDPSQNAEKMKLPGFLAVFNNSLVAYSLVMGTIFGSIVAACGPEIAAPYCGTMNFVIYGIMQGFICSCGVYVLGQGVQVFVGELLPAFLAITDKFIPGAIPALDIPVVFAYGERSLILGFLFFTLGQLLSFIIMIAMRSPVIAVPSVLIIFFCGAIHGIFANAWGGIRAIAICCFTFGVITLFGSSLLAYITNANLAIWGQSDHITLWLPIALVLRGLFGAR